MLSIEAGFPMVFTSKQGWGSGCPRRLLAVLIVPMARLAVNEPVRDCRKCVWERKEGLMGREQKGVKWCVRHGQRSVMGRRKE